jgi:hypothetical protein
MSLLFLQIQYICHNIVPGVNGIMNLILGTYCIQQLLIARR